MVKDLQKASLTKRFSAFLFDGVLIVVLAMAFMLLISMIIGYDAKAADYENRISDIRANFDIPDLEEKHKISLDDYFYLSEEELAKLPEEVKTAFDDCVKQLRTDSKLMKMEALLLMMSLIIVSFSLLLSFLALEFAVPLFFKNGQTLGKKMFSIAVMQIDGIKISPKVLFIRTVLGKYTIGTMVPVLMLLCLISGMAPLIPVFIILLVLLIQIVLMFTSRTFSPIHDSLAATVVVDFVSQKIFESKEEREEYLSSLHKDDSEQSEQ